MNTRRVWAFIFVCLLLVPCIGLCQKREAQERDIDRFTFTLGLKSLFLVDTEINYPGVGDVYYEGSLFGPVLGVQIANTDMFWDNFEFVLSTYFGKLNAYDSAGENGDLNANFNKFTLKLTDVRADACYRIIPHCSAFVAFHYRRFRFGSTEQDLSKIRAFVTTDEEMYGGGLGVKGSLPLGQSGVFVYGSGEVMPYAKFLIDSSEAWGLMLKGGLGYTIEGGEWLPVALTTTVGYHYQKLDSNGYFDEQTDAASADVVVSW